MRTHTVSLCTTHYYVYVVYYPYIESTTAFSDIRTTTLLQYMLHVPINYCRTQSVAAETSISPTPDAIPMDANPSYEEVHVYEHIDKKDTKQ